MNYILNLNKWVRLILPFILKTTNRLIWFDCILNPFKSILNEFESFRNEIDLKTQYSCEQLSLQTLLNNLFDPLLMRIRIQTNTDIEPAHYLNDESLFYGDEGLYFPSGVGKHNFEVLIPGVINTPENLVKITAWVNYYKFSGLNFIIKNI